MTDATAPLRGPLRKRESSLWARDPHDYYVEPPWVSERLFALEKFRGAIYDPACGSGNIVRSALAACYPAVGSDLVKRCTECEDIADFLASNEHVDNIVSNPPFGLCDDRKAKTHPFVAKALAVARYKVALLLPANWVQGDARSRWLETTPLRRVYFISPRPSMPPGDALTAGMKPGNGTTDYAWLIFMHGYEGPPEVRWLRRMP